MERKREYVLAFVALAIGAAIFIFGISGWLELQTRQETSCQTQEDCVPAQCCHPVSCISKAFAPDCADIVCTLECAPGTMDCGQGHCACEQNRCVAKIEGSSDLSSDTSSDKSSDFPSDTSSDFPSDIQRMQALPEWKISPETLILLAAAVIVIVVLIIAFWLSGLWIRETEIRFAPTSRIRRKIRRKEK